MFRRNDVASSPCLLSNNVLLAQIENKGLTVKTHCRSGFCGMCRVRLLKGQVAYDETPIAFVK
ncbi:MULTISPECIES: 2Fe-2S iron-sulfur cluster-binding protein [Xenorhabdus]|uniref:2Fe-2S iron-sulfur cluster-binding protein n=1 Tax=Xenorhabdus TaxID=626 RepID=UPI001E346F29|nr:2Fe-2S iron-sulfur cluster-binding protein [Xenorhabdus sp. NBAII XenSa04]